MEKNEKIEKFRKLANQYLNTLKPVSGEKSKYEVKIKLTSYTELNSIITQMLKSCILELEQIDQKTDVVLMLEMVLQFLPTDEFELLDRISEL